MRDYLQHGRRHSPGGSDPIPNLPTGGIKWAYLPGTAKTFAGNGGAGSVATIFSGANGFFYTNDPTVFAQGSLAAGGSTYYGISVLEVGHYLVWPYFGFVTAVATNPVNYAVSNYSSALSESSWEALPISQVIASLTRTDEVGRSKTDVLTAETGSTFPLGPIIYQVTNYTNYAPTAHVDVIAIQLDADGTAI